MDSNFLEIIINTLKEKYGGEAPLTFTSGKIHKYLGIVIYLSSEGEVIIHVYGNVFKPTKEANMT